MSRYDSVTSPYRSVSYTVLISVIAQYVQCVRFLYRSVYDSIMIIAVAINVISTCLLVSYCRINKCHSAVSINVKLPCHSFISRYYCVISPCFLFVSSWLFCHVDIDVCNYSTSAFLIVRWILMVIMYSAESS